MPRNRLGKTVWLLLILPGVFFISVFMLIPLFSILFSTFFPDRAFSLDNYGKLLQSVYFQQVFGRSVRLSLLSTALCALLGFPSAYYISRYSKRKGMMMALAVFPMFTSPVIRSFSWMVILGRKGIVNQFLVSAGLFSRPQALLYNEFSMTVGFVQLFLPQSKIEGFHEKPPYQHQINIRSTIENPAYILSVFVSTTKRKKSVCGKKISGLPYSHAENIKSAITVISKNREEI